MPGICVATYSIAFTDRPIFLKLQVVICSFYFYWIDFIRDFNRCNISLNVIIFNNFGTCKKSKYDMFERRRFRENFGPEGVKKIQCRGNCT